MIYNLVASVPGALCFTNTSCILGNFSCFCCYLLVLLQINFFFSSPEPKAQDELIGWDSSRRASVFPCVHESTLSNISISETSRPILIKFHLEHNWDGGLASLGFGPDRFRTLVSLATDISHRVIMWKTL